MTDRLNMLEKLQQRLDRNLLEDDDDLLFYMQISARLAALGNEEPLRELPKIFDRPVFRGRISDILSERCKEGIWDIQERSGEPLAEALIDAQDFHCFWLRMESLLPAELRIGFECWEDVCEEAELDAETVSLLRDFVSVFPIPDNELLSIVQTPIAEEEYQLLDQLTADIQIPVLSITWQKTGFVRQKTAELAFYADNEPSDRLKRYIESENQLETPCGTFFLRRQINDCWELEITLEDKNETSPSIDHIRLGALPAVRDTNDPSVWTINLKPFPHQERLRLLDDETLYIYCTGGFVIECKP